jgi:hypothetical protein
LLGRVFHLEGCLLYFYFLFIFLFSLCEARLLTGGLADAATAEEEQYKNISLHPSIAGTSVSQS